MQERACGSAVEATDRSRRQHLLAPYKQEVARSSRAPPIFPGPSCRVSPLVGSEVLNRRLVAPLSPTLRSKRPAIDTRELAWSSTVSTPRPVARLGNGSELTRGPTTLGPRGVVATTAATVLAVIGPWTADAAADPVIAAAGDIACDPSDPGYNGGRGTAHRCRQRATSDLLVGAGLAAVLPLGDIQYDSPSASNLKARLRPNLGAREVHQPSSARQPRRSRRLLLRLLQWAGCGERAGRQAWAGLLQLQRRRLAYRRAEFELHASVVRRGVDPRALAACRPQAPSVGVHARVLAPPALQLGP